MSKLSKLRGYVRSRAADSRPSSRTGLALGLLFAAGAVLAPLQADAASKLRVETKEGPVKGFLNNGVAEFLGIPYAEPPVGNLRWMPPKKACALDQCAGSNCLWPTMRGNRDAWRVCGSLRITTRTAFISMSSLQTSIRLRRKNFQSCSGVMAAERSTARATIMTGASLPRKGIRLSLPLTIA